MSEVGCISYMATLFVVRLRRLAAQVDMNGVAKIHGRHSGIQHVLNWVATLGFGCESFLVLYLSI